MVKGFNLPIDYILYDMSYANMIMYSSVLPSYNSKKDRKGDEKDNDSTINADDPRNRDKVKSVIYGNE